MKMSVHWAWVSLAATVLTIRLVITYIGTVFYIYLFNYLAFTGSWARNYRPCFRENQPKRSFSIKWKRAFWACFRENWVYKFGHWSSTHAYSGEFKMRIWLSSKHIFTYCTCTPSRGRWTVHIPHKRQHTYYCMCAHFIHIPPPFDTAIVDASLPFPLVFLLSMWHA